MALTSETLDVALDEVGRARKLVAKIKTKQVSRADDLDSLKSVAYAWFNTHRPAISAVDSGLDCSAVDAPYQTILESTAKLAAKSTYLNALHAAKVALLALRSTALNVARPAAASNTDDLAPDFSPLAGNEEMRGILTRRWHECRKCVGADAHLAAIVMMGGLLEALFVARANKMPDKSPLVNATSAPKDKATGKALNYQEWMLDSYIKVARELNWITESARGAADILKEYRNYVHPEKERRHGVVLDLNDSSMLWQVTKALVRQLLLSATR
jgi:hypothetical protein